MFFIKWLICMLTNMIGESRDKRNPMFNNVDTYNSNLVFQSVVMKRRGNMFFC